MTVPDPTRSRGEPRWLGPSTPLRAALIPPLSAARWLLVLVFFAGIYFFHGFLVPVLAALVIGFASWPIYSKLQRNVGGNSTIAATIAITLILAFLVVPITIAVFYTIDEVRQWFTWIVEANRDGAPVPEWMVALPGVGPWIGEQWTKHISTPGSIGALMQVASGANLIAFTTGRGSCFGCRPSPSIKLATNTAMFRRMEEDMDVNCGAILDDEATIDEMGELVFREMIATASGKPTKSELLGYGEDEFAPWHVNAWL